MARLIHASGRERVLRREPRAWRVDADETAKDAEVAFLRAEIYRARSSGLCAGSRPTLGSPIDADLSAASGVGGRYLGTLPNIIEIS